MAKLEGMVGGRKWAARSLLLLPILAVGALLFAILPASAGYGGATTTHGVTPYEVNLGGQPNDCGANVPTAIDGPGGGAGYPGLPSPATYRFRIVNISAGTPVGDGYYRHVDPGPGGATIELDPTNNGRRFDFRIFGGSVEDVIVKGGANSTHFAYLRGALGTRVTADTALHAPSKGRGGATNYYSTSHVEICYSTVASISGTKFRDNDTDGVQDDDADATREPGLGGWTITAYDSSGTAAGSAETAADGSYTIENLAIGQTYRVCETLEDLPAGVDPAQFSWAQSTLQASSWSAGVCAGLGGADTLPDGHQLTLLDDTTGIDFGNHLEVTLDCTSSTGNTATLNLGPGQPTSTVTCNGPTDELVSSFDLGRSDDADEWDQFVVFGGDPTGSNIVEQTVDWDGETAMYENDENGVPQLVVPTTLIRLNPTAVPIPAAFCGPGEPAPPPAAPDCLVSRTVNQNDPTVIQITEVYNFLGDPGRFR